MIMEMTIENQKKLNKLFGTNLPISEERLCKQAYHYIFDCYESKNDMLENGFEDEDIEGNDMVKILNGVYIFFNECNYDNSLGLPKGDWDKEELNFLQSLYE